LKQNLNTGEDQWRSPAGTIPHKDGELFAWSAEQGKRPSKSSYNVFSLRAEDVFIACTDSGQAMAAVNGVRWWSGDDLEGTLVRAAFRLCMIFGFHHFVPTYYDAVENILSALVKPGDLILHTLTQLTRISGRAPVNRWPMQRNQPRTHSSNMDLVKLHFLRKMGPSESQSAWSRPAKQCRWWTTRFNRKLRCRKIVLSWIRHSFFIDAAALKTPILLITRPGYSIKRPWNYPESSRTAARQW
jgi:hypothetical protein